VRDFEAKRSTTLNRNSNAADAGLAPGKRTLEETLPQPASAPEIPAATSAPVQRKAKSSALAPVPPSRSRPTIDDLFGGVQRKAAGADPGRPAVHDNAQGGVGGAGDPLPAVLRTGMERSFGADFGDVRVHHGSHVDDIGAKAYAQGSELHFAPGAYDPRSEAGRELIGHELTHVVQQRAGIVAEPQGKDAGGPAINADPALEAEADRLGSAAARGETVRVAGAGHGIQPKLVLGMVIQRGGTNTKDQPKDPLKGTSNQRGPVDDDELSPQERHDLIHSAFDRLVTIALEAVKQAPKGSKYDHLRHWSADAIRKDALDVAIAMTLTQGQADGVLSGLVMNGVCKSLDEARQLIAATYAERFGKPLYSATISDATTDDNNASTSGGPSVPVTDNTPPSLQGYVFRYRQDWQGTSALIAEIISRDLFSGTAADYGREIVIATISAMASQTPPDQPAATIRSQKGPYYQAVLDAARNAIESSHGAHGQGTQIGNTQATYSGIPDLDTNVVLKKN
jgi:hypothetical protein